MVSVAENSRFSLHQDKSIVIYLLDGSFTTTRDQMTKTTLSLTLCFAFHLLPSSVSLSRFFLFHLFLSLCSASIVFVLPPLFSGRLVFEVIQALDLRALSAPQRLP
jgi:hypothetical protein